MRLTVRRESTWLISRVDIVDGLHISQEIESDKWTKIMSFLWNVLPLDLPSITRHDS
jgi:hypothetical protein